MNQLGRVGSRGLGNPFAGRGAVLVLLGLTVSCAGCGVRDVDSSYGIRRGARGGQSVNGTGVLAGMFQQAGHRVSTRKQLSPRLDQADVIVWFPDDFEPPTEEVLQYLENWLSRNPQRTLIYVGRDYDAAVSYWEQMQAGAPPEQAVEVARRLARSRADHDRRRMTMPPKQSGTFFRTRRDAPLVTVGKAATETRLRGTWSQNGAILPAQLDFAVRGRLEPPERVASRGAGGRGEYQLLLGAGDVPIVWRLRRPAWGGGQVLVASNGSFLLNLPLVEPEHRKLAGQLIAECHEAGKAKGRVVFLESGPGGPPIVAKVESQGVPNGWEVLAYWPIGAILWHVLVLGSVYLLARMAIFGRPWDTPASGTSDFGHHIHALGELLQRSGQYAEARQLVDRYREAVRRDAAAGPRDAARARR